MNLNNAWAAALEDAAPIAEFDIDVNEAPEIDVDEDGAPLEAVDAEGEPTFEAIETEMVENAAEVEEAEEVAEKLEDTAVQLESAAVAIENRIAHHGGMTNGELEFMMMGLEGRVKNTKTLFPSTESFSHSRLSASNEALESVKKGLAFIWKTLRDAITAIMTKLRQWFGTVMRGAIKLKTRANGVKGTAARVTQNARLANISLNRVQSFMGAGGKIATDGPSALMQVNLLETAVSNILSDSNTASWVTYINSFSKVLEEIMKPVEGSFDEVATIAKVTSIKGYATAGYNDSSAKDANSRYPGTNARYAGDLPGGKSVFYVGMPNGKKPTTFEEYHAASRNRGARLDTLTAQAPKVPQNSEFKTLSKENIVKIAGVVASIADTIIDYQSSWTRRDKAVTDVQKAIDKAVKLVDAKKGDYSGDAKRQQVLGTILRGLGNEIESAPRADVALIQYALSTSSDYLAYCTRSIAAYKPAKEKKAKAAKA